MRNFKVLALTLFMLVFFSMSAAAVMAEDDEEAESSIKIEKGDKKPWEKAKISLEDAIKAALKEVAGTAIMAKMEVDDGDLIIEVYIVDKDGTWWEVEVDPGTGKVLEKEKSDDDDDDDEDDDDEEDDD